ncbi:MAG: coiled-coil domain-containing protein [Nitrospinaceae bacterium]
MKEKLEQLIEYVTGNTPSNEIYEARKEYQKTAGEIYEDDKAYETRMGLFLEWYICDRLVPEKQQSLLELMISENGGRWSREQLELFSGLANSINGLFMPKKIRDDQVVVLNLFDESKYRVKETHGKIMFGKGDIFQARIVPANGEYFFTGNFCFHPKEANKFIKEEIHKVTGLHQKNIKELKSLDSKLKDLNTQLKKNQREIEKITLKIESSGSPQKKQSLGEKLDQLKEVHSSLNQQITALKTEKSDLEIQKIKIEERESRNQLIQRLTYMNLKWERFRQIDLKDIYRN